MMRSNEDLKDAKRDLSVVMRRSSESPKDVKQVFVIKLLTTSEYNKAKKNRANIIRVCSIWTADELRLDKDLKRFDKDPYTAVAMFRMMAGIPADPRICPDDLTFSVDIDDIIARFSKYAGHRAAIKTCGPCGVRDIMVERESKQLPFQHNKISILECLSENLAKLSPARRKYMNLVQYEGKTYHLDSYGVDTEEGTVAVCYFCFVALAHSLRTKIHLYRRLHSTTMGLCLQLCQN